MFASLLIGLSLIIGGISLIAWGRSQWRKASESDRAWKAMQAHFAKLEQSPCTQVKGRARRERMALVNKALRREGA